MKIMKRLYTIYALVMATLLHAATGAEKTLAPPDPVPVMAGISNPLVRISPSKTASAVASIQSAIATATPATTAVAMKILVLAADGSEGSYQSITTFLDQIGVPYQAILVGTLTPDTVGNRLSNLALSDPVTGHGLYQGIIETNSTFGVCNPTCTNLLSALDWAKLDNYAAQFHVRVVSYYTYPEAKWGLTQVGSGAVYTAGNPLNVNLTAAGAAVFSYINSTNPVAVAGSSTDGIFVYKANPTAAAGETTTPILTAGPNTVGVTHTTSDGRETMYLKFDNYPTLLHSLALSYGVINWVTKGVFLGSRQIYFNPQDDDLLMGTRLYAPTLPQCPNDPSCPYIRGTRTDMQSLANWQAVKHQDPQFPDLFTTFAIVGIGSTYLPANQDTLPQAMKDFSSQFGWISHTWSHPDFDCYTLTNKGVCVPATLSQSLSELGQNIAYITSLGLSLDTTGLVTPFEGGLDNAALLQAAAQKGITAIVSSSDPPSPGVGIVSTLAPSVLLIPRRGTNLYWDVDSPLPGVYGSLPDEYNNNFGPKGLNPVFTTNQTYSQIIDNESTVLLQSSLLRYELYPIGFHTSNSIAYDGVHSLMSDLFDAMIQKYKRIYTLPVHTLGMKEIAPLLLNRASYNASGVTGIYTPGVSIVLNTVKAATIPITGACSQVSCPTYGGQLQDSIMMAANSTVTLPLGGGATVELSSVSLNPASVTGGAPSTGTVSLTGAAPTGGIAVALSSNSAAAVLPATVIVGAGSSTATFTLTTKTVPVSTSATISAVYSGVTVASLLTITPSISLSGVSLNPASVIGGSPSTGTVSLTGAAPTGGIAVALSSNNAAAVVPATVTVVDGNSTATFTVTTKTVTASASATLTAIYNGITVTAPLTVTPATAQVSLSSLTLNPATVVDLNPSTGTVSLTGAAPTGGVLVSLSSNNPAAVVPPAITVPAGSVTATFEVTTTAVNYIAKPAITAIYNGVTIISTLTITPPITISAVSLSPSTVTGGIAATGTVTLTGAAPIGGAVVSLSSNNPAAVVPATVSVGAGSSIATFTVTTRAVNYTAIPTITAAYGGITSAAAFNIVGLYSVFLSPATVKGGGQSIATVTLTGVAPESAVVSLSSSSAVASVPAAVTVNAGSSTASFVVTTNAVSTSTVATIAVKIGGLTQNSVLTVTP
jgi:hypothetical protein